MLKIRFFAYSLFAFASLANSGVKTPISAEAFTQWTNLAAPVLSDDGQWLAYTLSKGDGAQELVVRNIRIAKEFRMGRGALPRGMDSEEASMRFELALRPTQFSADSQYVLFAISPPIHEIAERDDLTSRPEILHSLAILHLTDGRVTRVPDVVSYSLPDSSGRHLAYIVRNPTLSVTAQSAQMPSRTLVIRDLQAHTEERIFNVGEFVFDTHGRYLVHTIISEIGERNGAYLRQLCDGRSMTLVKGAGRYRSLKFDPAGNQLTFLSDRDEHGQANARYGLYHVALPFTAAKTVLKASSLGDLVIDPDAGVSFTGAGNGLVFGIIPKPKQAVAVSRDKPISTADIQLWHSKDPGESAEGEDGWRRLPKIPEAEAYLALYQFKTRRWAQLGSISSPRVLLSPDARFAVGIDDSPYQLESTWSERQFDLYIIDVNSGSSHVFRRGVKARYRMQPGAPTSHFSLSPTGHYLMFFEDSRWWSVDLGTEKLVDLTGGLLPSVRFDHDDISNAAAGIAGWTAADNRVLIYSRHDIWEIDPAGITTPRSITDGLGIRRNIRFRLWSDAWDEDYDTSVGEPVIDPSESLLLIAVDQNTMATGIWRDKVGVNALPENLVMVDKRIVPVAKASDPQQYLLTMETFAEYPDVWAGPRIDRLTKISNANPQQRSYRWGSVEVVMFTSELGVSLKGLLYKPDGFDSSKQYPMVVSIYAESTPDLHRYVSPVTYDTPSALVSNGYLYFRPDIPYAYPYSAQNAVAGVTAAVRALTERGFVDPNRIALTGFSFGGYEVNTIITQTGLFRCAVSAVGAVDPIAYHGSVGGYGPSYVEIGQWKLGGSIWDRPFVYIANSPLLSADRVQTPLLAMSNDRDNAVPLSQGLAFFFALQRHGKQVWLIRYPNEGHVFARYTNRLDWDQRMIGFLDHYLKDAPRPRWMQNDPFRF